GGLVKSPAAPVENERRATSGRTENPPRVSLRSPSPSNASASRVDRLSVAVAEPPEAKRPPRTRAVTPVKGFGIREVSVASEGAASAVTMRLTATPRRVSYFMLDNPPRLVMDCDGVPTEEGWTVKTLPTTDERVRRVRTAAHQGHLRLVLDL